jgi:hypothetical protein
MMIIAAMELLPGRDGGVEARSAVDVDAKL